MSSPPSELQISDDKLPAIANPRFEIGNSERIGVSEGI